MAVSLVVAALSFFAFPGMGMLMTFSLMTISCALMALPIVGFLKNKKNSEISVGANGELNVQSKGKNSTKIVLIPLGLALSVLVIGALFRLMYWPGGSVQSTVGLICTLPMALLTFFVSINDKVDTLAKWTAVVAACLALLFGTNYLYQVRDLFRFRDFPQCQEAISRSHQDPTSENKLLQEVERYKVFSCEKDPETYRNLMAIEAKAQTMAAADQQGKVLFVDGGEYPNQWRVLGAFKTENGREMPYLSLRQYVEQEVAEGDILYIVSVSDGVKEKLVELGVDEGNIVVVR